MTRRADRPDPRDAQEAAAYIAEISVGLAVLARRCGLDALAFVLDMAREECDTILRGSDGAGGD
jgi:hypothetical protein